MTATDEITGPTVPPALPPRLYRSISSEVPRSQPLKPPRKSKLHESTKVTGVGSEHIYEDLDALSTSNPDVSQPEAKSRPVPHVRSKVKLNPQHDTNNTPTANYINMIHSGYNDNTANTAYVTKTAVDANTTQPTNSMKSSTYSTKTTYETGTTSNANTASKSHDSRRPSSTTSSTVDSTYNSVRTNKTHNVNPAKSSDRTGSTKNDAARDVKSRDRASSQPGMRHSSSMLDLSSTQSHQHGKNSNDYMTPRSARQALLPPLPPESKGPYSTAADASQDYITRTNEYMTPRSARQALRPPLSPEPKGPYSTAADASQDYTTRTNSNTSVKNPPPLPPPRLKPAHPLYCDRGNPPSQHRDNRNRHGPRSSLYHSASMLDLSSKMGSETSSLYDDEVESHYSSGSSLYTDCVYPQYITVLPNDYYNGPWTQVRRYEDDNQNIYREESMHPQENIHELLQWFNRVSRQSDTMSLYGLSMEDEMRSFHQQAMNVRKAQRLYNLLMKKRKEPLQKTLDEFKTIREKLEKVQKTNKTMGIAGGTTSAVGGVAAVVGIALAPMTMGTSLIATAVGAGIVATSAGGFGATVAKANKKIVNRETVEKLVNDYKSDVVDLEHCLNYILCLMKELQRHNTGKLMRAGAHPDALRMANLSQVVSDKLYNIRQMSPTNPGGLTSESMLKQFESEFDEYFTEKKGQKLNKSNKSKFSGRVGTLVKNLQEQLSYLDQIGDMLT